MNSRIALSGLSIVASLALMVGASYAAFSDIGTSTDNVFAAGSLDLKLSDDTPETDQDSVSASFGGTGLIPGQCLASAQLRVKNAGSINGDHVELAVVNTVSDINDAASPDMDSLLRLDTFDYDSNPIAVADTNGNGFADLDDLAVNGVDDLALTDVTTDHTIDVEVCLDESADNTIQGDSVDSDWTVTLNQDASQ